MKTSQILFAALLLQGHQAMAGPFSPKYKKVVEYLMKIFGEKQGDQMWDIKAHPQMCEVTMETHNGGACKAYVNCDDGVREYNAGGQDWNVCFVGGRQFFNDPRIGDFSITFTERDGAGQGEGLTTPVLQVQAIEDWAEYDVNPLANTFRRECGTGKLCAGGPYICWSGADLATNRFKKWGCAVPKLGKAGGGFFSDPDKKGYAPGSCGIHVIQYQKPDPAKDSYSLEITHLKDNNQAVIGGIGKSGPSVSLTSKLPLTVEIKTGGIDADPVRFAYGAQSWDSNDKRCSVGAYDNGKREMDCGFQCD